MKPKTDAEVAYWLAMADDDFMGVDLVLASGAPLWDLVCFHCQQGAEKYVKAALVALDRLVPKTHAIDELLPSLADVMIVDSVLLDEAAALSRHAVASRYPGFGRARSNEALEAKRRAHMIRNLVDAVFMKEAISR